MDTEPDLSTRTIETEKTINEKSHSLESLDYDGIDSVLNLREFESKTKGYFARVNVERWVVSFVIGTVTALLGVAIQQGVKFVANKKFDFMAMAYDACDNCFWAPFLIFISSNVILVSIASGLVCFVSLPAKGSGIPEIKSYLNGIKIPEVLRYDRYDDSID
eukprot:TRINITY_DN6323_c0_g1_i1.p2 TRINITY_DN6323_c0_g1~~TRINITY_DN6323_c0_g1_i1.p2  ORF type:complete len:162 (-),score=9.56 TRINITY_DN6323_c0_g1_i1:64-549(-)